MGWPRGLGLWVWGTKEEGGWMGRKGEVGG